MHINSGFNGSAIVVIAAFLTVFAVGMSFESSKTAPRANKSVRELLSGTNSELSNFVKGECGMSVEYMSASPETGVLSMASPNAVSDTTERVVRVLRKAGMTIFAQIDQQGAAQAVGLTMRPMVLVLFGNPKGGTPLMQAYPTLAIDLPLKALVWEDANGRVWVSTNSPEYLQRRHGLPETPFAGAPDLLMKAIESGNTK